MSQKIEINYEYFESLNGNFNDVLLKADAAAQYAKTVENAENNWFADSLYNYIDKLSESIRSNIRNILDSFKSTDNKIKEETTKIIGVEIYDEVINSLKYSQKVQDTIKKNLDFWLTIDDINAYEKIKINGKKGWCDKFADYVITKSGQKSPGKTITAMFKTLIKNNLVHGYYGTNDAYDQLNKTWNSNNSNICVDDYKPKTGDLVFFNWNGKDNEKYKEKYGNIDHVGVIYVDPNDGITYVVHGNYSDKVKKTKLDDLKKTSDHITVADMTKYNND